MLDIKPIPAITPVVADAKPKLTVKPPIFFMGEERRQQLAFLKQVFDGLDRGGDGEVSIDELSEAIANDPEVADLFGVTAAAAASAANGAAAAAARGGGWHRIAAAVAASTSDVALPRPALVALA